MTTKTERINLRCSSVAIQTLRSAAEAQNQDLTSFILGSALDRARQVLVDEQALRLSYQDANQVEKALARAGHPNEQLARLLRDTAPHGAEKVAQ